MCAEVATCGHNFKLWHLYVNLLPYCPIYQIAAYCPLAACCPTNGQHATLIMLPVIQILFTQCTISAEYMHVLHESRRLCQRIE